MRRPVCWLRWRRRSLSVIGVIVFLHFLINGESSALWKLIIIAAYVGSWVMVIETPGNRVLAVIIQSVITLGLVVNLVWDRPLSR